MLKVKMQQNNNKEARGNLVRALNGTLSLDDVINDIILESADDSEERLLQKQQFMLKVDKLAEKYLSKTERLVYSLYVRDNKSVAEIEKIMNFGCWYTSEKHIIKVFKILKIYYHYHNLDLKKLDKILKSNFTDYQREILKRLHQRKTYNEITDEMGGYYRKIYYDCMNIFEKLEKLGKEGKGYAKFLKDIRKFKRKGV